jgi:hypothetical protein
MKVHGLLLMLSLSLLLPCADAAALQAQPVAVELNDATATLTGPWQFHVGDGSSLGRSGFR